MSSLERKNPFFYGWVIVGIAWMSALLVTACTIYSFGLFTKPISTELGLSRVQYNNGVILFNLAVAVLSPFAGRLADRYPIKHLMLVGAVMIAVSLVTLGLSHSLLIMALCMGIGLPLGFTLAGVMIGYVLIARWFVGMRGRAMAIAAIGQSACGIIGAPIIAWAMELLGWRDTLIAMGVVSGVCLFMAALLVREHPGTADIEPGVRPAAAATRVPKSEDAEYQWTIGKLVRTIRFWRLAIAAALILSVCGTLVVTIVPYGIERGLSPVVATSLISAIASAGILGKMGLAVIVDRFDRSILLAVCALLLITLNILLTLDLDYYSLLAACVLCGAGLGSAYAIFAALIADWFGTKSYGTVHGLIAPVIAVTTALAIHFVGAVFDETGNYTIGFLGFTAALLIAAGLMVPRPAKREKASLASI